MYAAILDDASVIDKIVIDDDTDLAALGEALYPGKAIEPCPAETQIGWRRERNGFVPIVVDEPEATEPDPVPDAVEDWQFTGQAAAEGHITRDEALDWCGGGIVPERLEQAVATLITDEDQRFRVMIFLRETKTFPRHHDLVPLLGPLFGKTDDNALDAFWIAASKR